MTVDALSNQSQLIMRNSNLLTRKRCLIIAPPADELVLSLLSEGSLTNIMGLTQNFATYRYLEALWRRLSPQTTLRYEVALPDHYNERFEHVFFFLQKSKALMIFWLDMINRVLCPTGRVWLVGENKEGIKSWRTRLKTHFSTIDIIDNARHCGLIEATELLSHKQSLKIDDYFKTFAIEHQGISFSASSLPGVFSHGRIDHGTAVLLATLGSTPVKTTKKVLDFGCGAGIISAALALQQPNAYFTLVDCDALALESAKKTLTNLQVKNIMLLASDGLSEVSGTFDCIISNPPFHQGVHTHYEVTEQFLKQSYNYLVQGGELRIVANTFLKYAPIIKKIFGYCTTLDIRDGFSVYSARKLN